MTAKQPTAPAGAAVAPKEGKVSGKEAKPAEEKAVEPRSGRNSPVRRDAILRTLTQAELAAPLESYVRAHKRTFQANGANMTDIDSMKSPQVRKIIRMLPPKAFGLVEEWIVSNTKESLESFFAEPSSKGTDDSASGKRKKEAKKEDGIPVAPLPHADEMRLAERLFGLFVYESKIVPTDRGDVLDRARLLLACMHSERSDLSAMAWKIADQASRYSGFGKTVSQMNSVLDVILESKTNPEEGKENAYELAMLAAAVGIRIGNVAAAEADIEALAKREKEYAVTDELVLSQRLTDELGKTKPFFGLKARRTRQAAAGRHATANTLEVMAQCYAVKDQLEPGKPPYAFSNVLAVRELGTEEWYELANEETDRLFPQTGNLIHFSGRNQPEFPRRNSLGVFRVEEQVFSERETENQRTRINRVKATARLHSIQRVWILPDIPSTKPDMVRKWITENLPHLQERDESTVLLHLDDGLLIHGPYSEMVKEGFTSQFRCWRGLELQQTSSQMSLHVGELPATEERYDIAPTLSATMHALRELQEFTEEDKRKLTQALELLSSDHDLVDRLSTAGIRELKWEDSALKEIEGVILGLPRIRKHVDSLLKSAHEKSDTQVADRRDEFARISEEHKRVRGLIEGKRESLGSLGDELHSIIVKQVQSAMRDGRRLVRNRSYEQGADAGIAELLKEAASAGAQAARSAAGADAKSKKE